MALTQISTQGIKDGTITGTDLATNVDLVDNQKLRLGTGNDLEIFHDGTRSHILNNTDELRIRGNDVRLMNAAGNEHYFVGFANSYSAMYFDNTQRLLTNSIGAQCQGDFSIPLDNEQLRIGASNDIRMYHDGANSFLTNQTGTFYIAGDDLRLTNVATTETYLKGIANGAVELYHNNGKKYETESF